MVFYIPDDVRIGEPQIIVARKCRHNDLFFVHRLFANDPFVIIILQPVSGSNKPVPNPVIYIPVCIPVFNFKRCRTCKGIHRHFG